MAARIVVFAHYGLSLVYIIRILLSRVRRWLVIYPHIRRSLMPSPVFGSLSFMFNSVEPGNLVFDYT